MSHNLWHSSPTHATASGLLAAGGLIQHRICNMVFVKTEVNSYLNVHKSGAYLPCHSLMVKGTGYWLSGICRVL